MTFWSSVIVFLHRKHKIFVAMGKLGSSWLLLKTLNFHRRLKCHLHFYLEKAQKSLVSLSCTSCYSRRIRSKDLLGVCRIESRPYASIDFFSPLLWLKVNSMEMVVTHPFMQNNYKQYTAIPSVQFPSWFGIKIS